MGNLVVQLDNSSNWNTFYSTTVTATPDANGSSFAAIPEYTVPILADKHIIAVSISASNAKPTWHFGGFLNQKIPTGLTVGGLPSTDAVQKRRLYLDRLTLLIFRQLTSTYSISVEVPKWFSDFTLVIFEYTGPQSDSTENLINQLNLCKLPST